MNTGLRITVFAAALAATFGTAYGVGTSVGGISAEPERTAHQKHATASHDEHGGGSHEPAAPPGGLQMSDGGYTLHLKTPAVEAGRNTILRFTIVRDATGRPLTAYRREHTKELHLIIASRDLTRYRHLHPTRAADGTWSTPVKLPAAGTYRVFADFTPRGGEGLTLGADLTASGAYKPEPLPAPGTTAVTDGYEVSLRGRPAPGRSSELTLTVSRNGKPVRDLQPYLGAYGHLVALRSGDLAFTTTVPSPGTYRLFLDFKHAGEVHTAAFTVRALPDDGAVRPAA
ncbi:hypothetical protein ACFY1U_44125 [Streptomyces sp. NPDC001351]|uniref:hypothetical protein n=1 Tax=Streptomyces sp. NPDC001351 TaxID=3364564 RepID=UPI00368A9405